MDIERRYFAIAASMLVMAWCTTPVAAQEEPEDADEDRWFQVSTVNELGFGAPFSHVIQLSEEGTEFDYVEEGGQEVLFPYVRLGVEAWFAERHKVIFLWQPLDIRTRVRLDTDLVVDGATFEEGTPMRLRYNFPFYRVSYLFDFVEEQRTELAVGASLQTRNATVEFESADGMSRRDRRDVGIVPVIKIRGRYTSEKDWWIGGEADGIYTPLRLFGIDTDVVGSAFDINLRAGLVVRPDVDAFVNLRYFAGGVEGTFESQAKAGPGDGFTRNWLHLGALTLGFQWWL